jgi:hypothetical protein
MHEFSLKLVAQLRPGHAGERSRLVVEDSEMDSGALNWSVRVAPSDSIVLTINDCCVEMSKTTADMIGRALQARAHDQPIVDLANDRTD